jgi:hypothetical protein
MSSRFSHVGELLLLEWYAAYCVRLAGECTQPRSRRMLRSLAADLTIERDKYFRILLAARTRRDHSATVLKFPLCHADQSPLPQHHSFKVAGANAQDLKTPRVWTHNLIQQSAPTRVVAAKKLRASLS